MSNMICVEKAKPSTLKRLRFLPRIGLVVDFAGQQVTYRQAPFLETLINMKSKGRLTMRNFMEVALQQLKEIQLKEPMSAQEFNAKTKKKAKRKK